MKKKTILALALVVIFAVSIAAVWAASVEPVLFDPWRSGDAWYERTQAGCTSAFAYKVDEWDQENGMDNDYDHAGNTITISNSNGYTFDWSSEWPVCAVIVVAANKANVFYYEGGAYSDTGLYAPLNTNSPDPEDTHEISHVTFCFNEPDGMCYQDETAWAAGNRYVTKGNWATYTAYVPNNTVTLYAAQSMVAGTVHFSAAVDGHVDITINLTNGFIFYYDLNDDLDDHNIKVQDYDKAPKGNPAPGQFTWKAMAPVGSTSYTITVPVNKFYGVHLDVAYPVPCE